MHDSSELNPGHILQTGLAFWPSKVLLSAIELKLFTTLAHSGLSGKEIGIRLGLHPRGIADFLDCLVSLGFLVREGPSMSGIYKNTPETALFLDKNQESYVGGILEMANSRLYRFWGDLTSALKSGQPQNEKKYNEEGIFDILYKDPAKLDEFISAMSGISAGNFKTFAEKFDFSRYHTLLDVGGASAQLSIFCAEAHPHLQCLSFDLPQVEPLANKRISRSCVKDRVKAVSGDFFKDQLPKADVITMGMILHDWNLENKMKLIRAAYDALPDGGAFVAIENIIDDDRRLNAFGMMMSLNMLIEFGDAFDFTGADFSGWCKEVGFRHTEVLHLSGPASAAIAYK